MAFYLRIIFKRKNGQTNDLRNSRFKRIYTKVISRKHIFPVKLKISMQKTYLPTFLQQIKRI
jgi:hypothetical protein